MGAKVLCACANGSGMALMMQLTAERVIRELGMAVDVVHHCGLSEGKSLATRYDVVLVPEAFAGLYDKAAESGVTVVPLANVLSDTELRDKLSSLGVAERFS